MKFKTSFYFDTTMNHHLFVDDSFNPSTNWNGGRNNNTVHYGQTVLIMLLQTSCILNFVSIENKRPNKLQNNEPYLVFLRNNFCVSKHHKSLQNFENEPSFNSAGPSSKFQGISSLCFLNLPRFCYIPFEHDFVWFCFHHRI